MRRRGGPPERLLATVMFTDIVGSTHLASELGDSRWRQVLTRHHAFVRKELKRHGGREVDTAGDGFFAVFDQPARAVACARAVSAGLAASGIQIRAGIHMGEVEVVGRKVAGVAVHIGSRIMSSAGPQDVLVSNTVRDLMAGSDLVFADRGVHELKGVPGEWRLYAVEPEAAPDGKREQALGLGVPGPEPAARKVLSPARLAVAGSLALAIVLAVVLVATRRDSDGLVAPDLNTVAVIGESNEVLGAVAVGTTPSNVAVGEGAIWVTNFDDRTLQSIDPETYEATPARAVAGAPTGLAVGGGFVWVTSRFDENLLKIDPRQAHSSQPISVGTGAAGVAYGEGAAWVVNSQTDELMRIDADSDEVTRIRLARGSSPTSVAFGDGSVWIALSLGKAVVRFDPAAEEVSEPIPLGGPPTQLAFGEGYLWVTRLDSDMVTRVDPSSNRVDASIPDVGNGPNGVAVGLGSVWVANSLEGSVTRIDPRSASKVEVPVRTGSSAEGVAVTDEAVWVTLHSP